MFNFEVDAFDADGDDLEYMWDMGDESSKKDGDSVRHGYSDDGVYIIVVSVSDGETTTTKEFELIVENMDPTVNVMYDEVIDEGTEVSFAAQTDDVAADEVKVMWSFPDGSMMEGNFAQYTFRDDGEYLVTMTAEDEDGGVTQEMLMITVINVAPQFTQFEIPSGGEEGTAMDFKVSATDPGDDTIVYTFDFGDDTAVLMSQDGNMSHKFAEGDTFTVIICAQDEDGGETCRTETIPVSLLQQAESEGLLPGFSLIGVLSALGVIGILRRRTH
jgi:PKD repeat protein